MLSGVRYRVVQRCAPAGICSPWVCSCCYQTFNDAVIPGAGSRHKGRPALLRSVLSNTTYNKLKQGIAPAEEGESTSSSALFTADAGLCCRKNCTICGLPDEAAAWSSVLWSDSSRPVGKSAMMLHVATWDHLLLVTFINFQCQVFQVAL